MASAPLLRTDPTFLGLQKTRLLDPLLSFPGTNDQPGDYRASGCSACHVIYANDRSPEHSASYAQYGNMGQSATADPTIPKGESGHPIKHEFTRAIPSSQCMVCHMHPGTNMVATYFGYTWWDNEIDGDKGCIPPSSAIPPRSSSRSRHAIRSARQFAAIGPTSVSWRRPATPEIQQELKNTQFADFHGHGWIFRAVYKHDRKGKLLDAEGNVSFARRSGQVRQGRAPEDIHLKKGMHCIDCHFQQDSHGNGKLYGETRNAIEVDCVDCHGTIQQRATLDHFRYRCARRAAPGWICCARRGASAASTGMAASLFQRSMLEKDQQWEVVQVLDSITPGNPHYSEKSRLAKTIQNDGSTWGDARADAYEAGARKQPHDLLFVSQFVGADLLRLPSFR